MKIAIMIGSLTHGGAERVASLWAKGFNEKGYTVNLILNNHGKPITYEVPHNVKILNLYSKKESGLMGWIRYILKFRKYLKNEKPDVIISVLEPHGIAAKLAMLTIIGLKIPVINTEHNAFERPTYAPLSCGAKLRKFFVNKWYDKVTILTDVDRQVIANRLKNIVVLPNPLSFAPYDSSECEYREKQIVAVGRVYDFNCKGFDLLVKSWSRIAKKYPNWTLKIIGAVKKPTIETLKIFMEQDVSNQLEFINYTPNILEFYRNSEIFILSSRYEGYGMVLLEAMSQGCACIACDYKGRQREICGDDNNALVIPADDIEVMTSSIEELILNEGKRKMLQRNGPVRAQEFSLDKIMQIWDVIFDDLGLLES